MRTTRTAKAGGLPDGALGLRRAAERLRAALGQRRSAGCQPGHHQALEVVGGRAPDGRGQGLHRAADPRQHAVDAAVNRRRRRHQPVEHTGQLRGAAGRPQGRRRHLAGVHRHRVDQLPRQREADQGLARAVRSGAQGRQEERSDLAPARADEQHLRVRHPRVQGQAAEHHQALAAEEAAPEGAHVLRGVGVRQAQRRLPADAQDLRPRQEQDQVDQPRHRRHLHRDRRRQGLQLR